MKFFGAKAVLPTLMISGSRPSSKEEITPTKTTHLTEPNDAPDQASIILQAPPRPIVSAKDSDLIVSLDSICSPDASHGNIILPPETIGIGDQFIEVVVPGLFLDTFLHITPTNNLELISPADNVTCVDASLFAHDFKDADVYMGNTIKPYTGDKLSFFVLPESFEIPINYFMMVEKHIECDTVTNMILGTDYLYLVYKGIVQVPKTIVCCPIPQGEATLGGPLFYDPNGSKLLSDKSSELCDYLSQLQNFN
jgi:hypothetical protein